MNREIALFAEIYPLLHKKSPARAEQELDTNIIPQSEENAYERDQNQIEFTF